MPVWFITGTSRGIGLETVRQLAANGANTVIASCRNPASATALSAIKGPGQLHVVALDIDSDESIRAAVEKTAAIVGGAGGIDYLVNNAGIGSADGIDRATPEELRQQFETNVIGTLRVFRAFLPLVRAGTKKVVVNVSTSIGSVGADLGTKCASYAIAKAAQNMLTYKLTKQYPDVTIIAFNPGWIKTDMGTDEAPLELVPTITQHIKVYQSIDKSHAGKFLDFEGKEVPW